MSEPKGNQKRLIDEIDGIFVVDAGPGTGKTTTVVGRYVSMLKRGILPKNILMLTFTDNAAMEMERRIKEELRSTGDAELIRNSKDVLAMTFDSFCHSIVAENAQQVNRPFGTKHKLTSAATISTNDSLNRKHFKMFFDEFNNNNCPDERYGDYPAILALKPFDIMKILENLMAKGIIAVKNGWFGLDPEKTLAGDCEKVLDNLRAINVLGPKGGAADVCGLINDIDSNSIYNPPDISSKMMSDEDLMAVAYDDRKCLIEYIHDLYLGYVVRCIKDNRLTFGLNATFAFMLLYSDAKIRERNSFDYVTIDEFQDTNENQLMMSLMIMRKGNLCAVGDLKQGIYGFRYVSIENITKFEERAERFKTFLNRDEIRVGFDIKAKTLPLENNYRSSKDIVDEAFRVLRVHASDGNGIPEDMIVEITAANDDVYKDTHVRYVPVDLKDKEADEVLKCIRDYVSPGRYTVYSEDNDPRPMRYSDITVLCSKNKHCRAIMRKLTDEHIPAYLQGDVEVMSTVEGKMALAWLRYVNNKNDLRGLIPILAHEGYNAAFMRAVKKGQANVPKYILDQRAELVKKKRRITDLLTELFGFYRDKMNGDIIQSIIAALSSEHRNSLITVSDIITTIEDDIANRATYPVEVSIDRDAVRIMTMHKSKGMQFQTVIIPYLDEGTIPKTGDAFPPLVRFDPYYGLRCMEEVGRFDGYEKICKSWKSKLAVSSKKADYKEERRVLFVAMTRAKQYLTMIYCSDSPSQFLSNEDNGLLIGREKYAINPESEEYIPERSTEPIDKPEVGDYTKRKEKLSVHDIMELDFGNSRDDEISGEGMVYGTEVHEDAQVLFYNGEPKKPKKEHDAIRKVLESVKDASLKYSEMEMKLPVDGTDVVLKGYIDLIALYPDRIVIHDYKTDAMIRPEIEKEYILQLSVYAQAASSYYNLPARCVIDYVSLGETKEFEPVDMSVITERVLKVRNDGRDVKKE
ncbi:MAG: UvrD-helicase domain-containing protein [Candidatus Methanomethylophilaceae archaeon]|nr:UvrD-helicase domain-containing protein [Candidatus Methanomethylophilaceae archaeon]